MSAMPSPSSPLAGAVHAILRYRQDSRFLALNENLAILSVDEKTKVMLLAWDPDRAEFFSEHLGNTHWTDSSWVVGLVGGGDRAREALASSRPGAIGLGPGKIHLADNGDVWHHNASWLHDIFITIRTTPPYSPEAWDAVCRTATMQLQEEEVSTQETLTFVRAIESRRPIATQVLLGLIAAVFGLEYFFGGTDAAAVLLRMGALAPQKVAEGEIWRLFSCTFLHAGLMHFLFNSYVLWIIGSSVERVLGTWRFLVLYGLSCLGASLTSMVFLEGFSVGASGGLWGLLAAEAVLAWHSKGLLPQSMIAGARRAAAFNFGINLLNSFRPQVDMWAHFGGGAVGGLLLLTGVLTRGLVKLDDLETIGSTEESDAFTITTHPLLRAVGGSLAVLLVSSLAIGLLQGRPWELRSAPTMIQTSFPGMPYSLDAPENFEVFPNGPEDPPGGLVGDILVDPGALEIAFYAGDLRDETVLAGEVESVLTTLQQPPKGTRVKAKPREITLLDRPGVTVRYAFDNGMEEERSFLFMPDGIVQVGTLRFPEFEHRTPKGYTHRVLESLHPVP